MTETMTNDRRCNEDCLGGHPHEADCALRHDHVGECGALTGDVVLPPFAERANGDRALHAEIEDLLLNEPNLNTAADRVRDLFVAWLARQEL